MEDNSLPMNDSNSSGTQNPDSLYFEADKLSREGKFAEAKDVLNKVISLNPNHAQALNFLGWLNVTKYYDYNQARSVYERS